MNYTQGKLAVRKRVPGSSQYYRKAGPVGGGKAVVGMENRPPASSPTAKTVGGTSWKDLKAEIYSTGKFMEAIDKLFCRRLSWLVKCLPLWHPSSPRQTWNTSFGGKENMVASILALDFMWPPFGQWQYALGGSNPCLEGTAKLLEEGCRLGSNLGQDIDYCPLLPVIQRKLSWVFHGACRWVCTVAPGSCQEAQLSCWCKQNILEMWRSS